MEDRADMAEVVGLDGGDEGEKLWEEAAGKIGRSEWFANSKHTINSQ